MKIDLKHKSPNNFIDKIKELQKTKIKSGYFSDQGLHSSGMGYSDLAYKHAKGFTINGVSVPSRDVRPSVILSMRSNDFKKIVHRHLYKYIGGEISYSSVMNQFGNIISDTAKSRFGVPSPSNPMNSSFWAEVKGFNAPLVHTGELMDNWTYRIQFGGGK